MLTLRILELVLDAIVFILSLLWYTNHSGRIDLVEIIVLLCAAQVLGAVNGLLGHLTRNQASLQERT